ncbi:alpha/beta hydrolase-fold protein [uncultured Clostridium sp.]|jgi:enterochelin esterase family protein|uniref:alpha/beta hydrolase n=1 Tax=uncultured Clostridium sp. TaxID=59620 RepID=UPI0026383D8E|nr:alpha/beta hydrolase-fold protein [uncultured Clostridium sp.]
MNLNKLENNLLELINKNEEGTFPLTEKIANNDKFVEVTFIYKPEAEVENILLVLPIGGKKLSKNLMINIDGTNIWYKKYIARNDIKFLYYFSVNDSLDVRKPRNLNELSLDTLNPNFLIFNGETKLSYLTMPNCKENPLDKMDKTPIGQLINEEIYSCYLNKNITITTYLPPLFDENTEYGLALFTDGDEHIELLSANIILDNLISQDKIKPMIGLFVDSNMERSIELRCDKNFESFVIKELIPFIKEKYKISENPKDNLISGFSLGGLTAGYLSLKHPDIFSNILSQSGSYFFEMTKIKKLILDCKKKPNIYLNFGALENKEKVINSNKKIYAILRKNKFKVTCQEFKSGHDYLSWGEYLTHGLLKLLSK